MYSIRLKEYFTEIVLKNLFKDAAYEITKLQHYIFHPNRKSVSIFNNVTHENHTINIYLKKPPNTKFNTIKDIALNAQVFSHCLYGTL